MTITNKTKRLLILGGTSDIGLEIAHQAISAGYEVWVHGRSFRPYKSVTAKSVKFLKADFTDDDEVESFRETCRSLHVNTIISAVGMLDFSEFSSINISNSLSILKVNAIVPWAIVGDTLQNMITLGYGRILMLSSVGHKFGGGRSNFGYSASKYLTEFIPAEVKSCAKNGIFYNVLQVGVVDTRIHAKVSEKDLESRSTLIPIGRVASSSEVAQAALWLVSSSNTYVTNSIVPFTGGE